MKKNDRIEITITDIGVHGEGIGKANGFTFFVKDTVPGDHVLATVMKLKRNYGYARLQEILFPSKDRADALCPSARACGGCSLQAMTYERQLLFKQEKIRSCLLRLGGFSDPPMEPILGMENPFRYRNKAQYPVGYDKNGRIAVGFYAAGTHSIVPVEDCVIGPEENREIIRRLVRWMEEEENPPYQEETGEGCIRHILIRKAFSTGEILVCLVVNRPIQGGEALMATLEELPEVVGITINHNSARTNVILGERTTAFYGKPAIEDVLAGIRFSISTESFYQVNPVQTEKLYERVMEYAALTGKETVWDLFCGIGTISLFLAKKAKKVFGVELNRQAVEDAKRNAKRNGIDNAEFLAGKAEEIYPAMIRERADEAKAEVIVVDPPRKGCERPLLEAMLGMQPERIVYVSCDPATLARDLRILCDGGYELKRVQGVDCFSQTPHVETVVSLSLKSDSPKIEVSMKPGEDSLYEPHDKGTYEKIKAYVLEKYGFKVSSLYIAQTKDKCGLDKRLNYNLSKKDDPHVPECPKEKEDAIMDAFRHFGLIE